MKFNLISDIVFKGDVMATQYEKHIGKHIIGNFALNFSTIGYIASPQTKHPIFTPIPQISVRIWLSQNMVFMKMFDFPSKSHIFKNKEMAC